MGIGKAIKQKSFGSEQVKAHVNLIYTFNWLRDLQAPIFKRHGILSQHYNLMRIVRGKHPEPTFPSHIKAVMLDKNRDVTRLVSKLVKLELLERQQCQKNRRQVEISITEAGLDLVQEIEDELLEIYPTHFALDDEDAAMLSNLLDRLRGEEPDPSDTTSK